MKKLKKRLRKFMDKDPENFDLDIEWEKWKGRLKKETKLFRKIISGIHLLFLCVGKFRFLRFVLDLVVACVSLVVMLIVTHYSFMILGGIAYMFIQELWLRWRYYVTMNFDRAMSVGITVFIVIVESLIGAMLFCVFFPIKWAVCAFLVVYASTHLLYAILRFINSD